MAPGAPFTAETTTRADYNPQGAARGDAAHRAALAAAVDARLRDAAAARRSDTSWITGSAAPRDARPREAPQTEAQAAFAARACPSAALLSGTPRADAVPLRGSPLKARRSAAVPVGARTERFAFSHQDERTGHVFFSH